MADLPYKRKCDPSTRTAELWRYGEGTGRDPRRNKNKNERASSPPAVPRIRRREFSPRSRTLDRVAGNVGASVVGYTGNTGVAVAEIAERKPHAIILDLHLDAGTGFDVLQELAIQRIPVVAIVLTNFTAPILQEKAAELGATYFFDKTSDIPRMMRALNDLVEKHQQRSSTNADDSSAAREANIAPDNVVPFRRTGAG